MRRSFLVSACSLLFVVTLFSWAFAIDITADMISKEGKVTRNGKIYVKDNKFRIEKGSTPIYTIIRGDKGLVWQMNGAENTYVEAKLTPAFKPWTEEKIPGETVRKDMGTENIGGRQAKKYEVTVKQGSKTETYHQWFASDIRFPLKIANVNGKWSIEYKNIKNGAPPDAIFNLPAGATLDTMTVPDVLGGH